ncbi:MAG: Flp family type IVb pilin [Myxococcaceae bacterium]
MKTIQKRIKKNRGQGMTEYIIVVALVAIAAIGVVTLFGENIRRLFADSADSLVGSTSQQYGQSKKAAQYTNRKGLDTFADTNL